MFLSSFCIIFRDIDGSFMGVCYIIFSVLFFLLNIFIFQKQLQMRNKKFLVEGEKHHFKKSFCLFHPKVTALVSFHGVHRLCASSTSKCHSEHCLLKFMALKLLSEPELKVFRHDSHGEQ